MKRILFGWRFAMERLIAGDRLYWYHWGNSYIVRDGNFIRRVAVIQGVHVVTGNFQPSIDKLIKAGWGFWRDLDEEGRNEILFRKFGRIT